MRHTAERFSQLAMLASFLFLVAFLVVSVYLFAKPDRVMDWFRSYKDQSGMSKPISMQTTGEAVQQTPLPVVFSNQALSGDVTASGVVKAFDTNTNQLWLQSMDGSELETVWACEGEVEVLNPGLNERYKESATGVLTKIKAGVQVFGACDTPECSQLVTDCMVVLQ